MTEMDGKLSSDTVGKPHATRTPLGRGLLVSEGLTVLDALGS